ncbi:MAG: MlaD family protein [Catalinimonas sp.]
MSKEFKVGLMAVVSGVTLYLGFNFLKGADLFSSTRTYYAYYDNVDGLTVSNAVMLNGLAVGRVEDIDRLPERNNTLRVAIDIDHDVVLGERSEAVLTDSDLLGGKMIRLEIGQVATPLNAEDTLIGTVEIGLAEKIGDKAMPVLDDVDSITTSLRRTLASFEHTAAHINTMLVDLEGTSTQLRLTVNENRGNLRGITANMNSFTRTLAQTDDQLAPLLTKMNGFADTLQALELAAAVEKLNASITELNGVMAKVNSGEGSMGQLVTDEALYNNLNESAANLSSLLADLEENPKRYVHFSVFGRKDKKRDRDDEEEDDEAPEDASTPATAGTAGP